MKPKDRTQERTQKAGAYAALGVAGAFVLVIAYFVVFGGGNRGGTKGAGEIPKPGSEMRVPLGQAGGQMAGPARDGRFDLTDKKDPSKRIGLLMFAVMDPLPDHRYSVEKPEAWRFLDGGRMVYIRADSGTVYSPQDQKSPESGTIRGNVEIKLFEAGLDFQKIDPATTPALLIVKTESLSFESAVGELMTPDPFTVVWKGGKVEGEAKGEGLSLVMDQPNQRLARGEILRKGDVKLWRTDEKTQATAAAAPIPAPQGAAAAPPETVANAAKPAAPIETIYRLIGNEQVVASQGGRRLTADNFQVLARLLDNKLPENAIRPVRFVKERAAVATGGTAANERSATSEGVAADPAAAPTATSPAVAGAGGPADEPLVLTWEGPCVIVPLASAPAELAQDHIAARFSAKEGGQVAITDEPGGISGNALAIDYGATSGMLSLIGADSKTVALAAAASGRIETLRLDADLVTGIVKAPGAGMLVSAAKGEAESSRVSWTEKGQFAFETTSEGLTGFLKEATVVGGVKGEGRDLRFTSSSAAAAFVKSATGRPEVSRVDLEGDAVANSADTGALAGQKIHVEFDPPTAGTTNPRARFVRAEDGFSVDRQGQHLSGNYLESRLIDVAPGKVDVGSALARGGVEFKSEKDFVSGKTEELNADLGFDENGKRKQMVVLVGEGTTLSRNEPGQKQGTVSGSQLLIDGVLGKLESFGPGTFAYRGLSGTDDAKIDAEWSRRMVYDESAGLIDLWGGSKATYWPDANTKNNADADRIKLFVTPGTRGRTLLGSSVGEKETDAPTAAEEVSIRAAEAYGSVLDREGGTNARIESRSYAAGELQKLSYVEGPSILANNEKGTLDIPGAGKFLLVDQRVGGQASSSAPGVRDLGGGDSRGQSLFEWATSLHGEKHGPDETILTMKDGVSVVHRALKDDQITEIKCADLVANLKDKSGSIGEPGKGMELQSVVATGSVYAASGPPKTPQQPRPPLRELIAQTLEYDAIGQRIDAKAAPGGIVTMFEPSAASPTTAAWLTWDMVKNSVQVKQPAGAAPR